MLQPHAIDDDARRQWVSFIDNPAGQCEAVLSCPSTGSRDCELMGAKNRWNCWIDSIPRSGGRAADQDVRLPRLRRGLAPGVDICALDFQRLLGASFPRSFKGIENATRL